MLVQRLAVYSDSPFRLVDRPDGQVAAIHISDVPTLLFVSEVGKHFDSVLVLGRAEHAGTIDDFVPLQPNLRLVSLPYYPALSALGSVAVATPRTIARFWRALAEVDQVWIDGPHPLGFMLILLAVLRRREVVLIVRQDTVSYYRARLPSARWSVLLPALRAMNGSFRLFARRFKTLVVGEALAAQYGGTRPRLLMMADSLVSERDVAPGPKDQVWEGQVGLLAVARLEPDKDPLLLIDALGRLEREEPGRYRLVCAGGGPMLEAVRERAKELGVADQLELRGWVPFGPELLDLYREAHIFVRATPREGVPRVLYEAMACATPIVVSDVGGVRAALDDGRAGLLVPPSDVDALVDAVQRITRDPELRNRLVIRGLELVQHLTLEAQAARVASFLTSES